MKWELAAELAILFVCFCLVQASVVNRNGVVLMDIDDKRKSNQPSVREHAAPHSSSHSAEESIEVVVDLDSYVNRIGPMFVGVTLDSSLFRREWKCFNTSSKQLQSLAKGLAPSHLRVGGTAADFFIFEHEENRDMFDDQNYDFDQVDNVDYYSDCGRDLLTVAIKNYTVTARHWKQLNDFIHEVGWNLVFDFNQFLREGDRWDPDNARELLTFSQKHNFSIPHFQLGNEPNSYYHNFDFRIPASRLAKDMQQLRSLLSEFPAYCNSTILGPDVTRVIHPSARNYLQEFLSTGGQNVVAAVTLHHYYFNAQAHGASVHDFVNTTILNYLLPELSVAKEIAGALAPELPLWFTETSSVSGGGLPGVSDGYAAGFMWLDKLGLSALAGFKRVLRQSFFHGNYALVSPEFAPYPDYFLTLLYKRLVQGPVFNVTSSTDAVRIYAGCTNPSSYQKGALTVYILNVRDQSTNLSFTQFPQHQYDLYLLTPGDGQGLRSPFVALNGQKLAMIDEELPPLHPFTTAGNVTFPAYSFGFVVFPQAGVQLCQS